MSYLVAVQIYTGPGRYRLTVTSGPGWVAVGTSSADYYLTQKHFELSIIKLTASHRVILAYPAIYSAGSNARFYFPLWLISLASILLSLGLILSHYRKIRNYQPGLCDTCGYDMRFTPDRCPECGTKRAQ